MESTSSKCMQIGLWSHAIGHYFCEVSWRSHYSSVSTLSVKKVAPMKQPCTAVAVASLDHKVYAIGGECAKTPRETHYLKSVELYDPMHYTWDVSQGGYLMELKKSRSPSPDRSTHLVVDRTLMILMSTLCACGSCVQETKSHSEKDISYLPTSWRP